MRELPSAEDLKAGRKRLRLTQEEVAQHLGISRVRWTRYEYGHSRIPRDLVAKFHALVEGGLDSGGSQLFGTLAPIPVMGRAAAGAGETNVDSDLEPIYVPAKLATMGGIGFVIDGESMMPALQPGDVAVFKPESTPRRGYSYLIKTAGDEFRCKNLEWKDDRWALVSLKPSFLDEQLEDGQIVGLLVGCYRSMGSYEMLEADPNGLRLTSR